MDPATLVMPTSFETERFVLRSYGPGDGPMVYAAAVRNRAHLARYESVNVILTPKNEAEAEDLVRDLAAEWSARRAFFVGILDKATGAWMGQLYIGVINWATPEFELGYVVDRDHQGQGVIAESVEAALAFVFEHLQAHRVTIHCDDTNERSARVAQRAGFTREGHLREDHRHADGTYTGTYVYGLLAGERPAR